MGDWKIDLQSYSNLTGYPTHGTGIFYTPENSIKFYTPVLKAKGNSFYNHSPVVLIFYLRYTNFFLK